MNLNFVFLDVLPLPEVPKEGYICVAQSSLCRVYLPQGINENLSLETLADTNLHPKLASNEIQITPVVRITSDSPSLSLEKPAIIELLKTIQLSDKEANNKVIPLYANSQSLEWKEVGSECNCKVLNDRISLEVTHFSLYAVISRKPCPSSTVKVQPSADIPAPDQLSTPTELTIPELPGFKVQIPPSSVNADREIDITATVLYDNPAVCSEDDRSRLASSCIELEPHGTTFSKEVSISIPILNYAQVKQNHPNAQLQICYSDNEANVGDGHTELSWTLVEHLMHQDEEDRYVAIVLINHFTTFRAIWDYCVNYFYPSSSNEVESIKARCQVFMSQEVTIKSFLTFSIAVLYCPYEREPVLDGYKYQLLESGLLDLKVSQDNVLHFRVELDEILESAPSIYAGKFSLHGRQRQEFRVKLDRNVELVENLPIGQLSLGKREGSEDSDQILMLIKVYDIHNFCCDGLHFVDLFLQPVQQIESEAALPASLVSVETVILPSCMYLYNNYYRARLDILLYTVTSTVPLGSDFLSDVLERLWCVRHKWHNLGLALRMDSTTLDLIEKLYPRDTDSCFRELMKKWLMSGHETSWSTLVKALESPLVRAVIEEG